MFEELSAGQYLDWCDFHRQFNLAFDKPDIFWALSIADFRNANRGEGDWETKPFDILPWVDPYADDESFIAGLRAFAEVHGEKESGPLPSSAS